MKLNISNTSLIACICEGGAETEIMNILLDNDMLIFNRQQLIDEEVIPRTNVEDFERKYLRREYDQNIIILRVIDSRSEKFNLSKAYSCQIEVINVITAPEIEILIIVSKGKYDDYCRSGIKKPSQYCKSELKIKDFKSPTFVKGYFGDVNFLLETIKKYHRVHKQGNKEASLYDLIKNKNGSNKSM